MMNYNGLDVKAQLNIDANSIATITTTIPINTHVISVPFSMYINNKYIHYRFDHSIHIDSHKHEAQSFLQNKYTWSTKISHSINWDSHASCLLSLPDSLERFSLHFIHHRLSTGNMLFDSPHPCPYCKITFTSSSAHAHFLTYPSSSSDEYTLLHFINTTLSTLHTPPLLQQHIIFSYRKYITLNVAPLNIQYFPQLMNLVKCINIYNPDHL